MTCSDDAREFIIAGRYAVFRVDIDRTVIFMCTGIVSVNILNFSDAFYIVLLLKEIIRNHSKLIHGIHISCYSADITSIWSRDSSCKQIVLNISDSIFPALHNSRLSSQNTSYIIAPCNRACRDAILDHCTWRIRCSTKTNSSSTVAAACNTAHIISCRFYAAAKLTVQDIISAAGTFLSRHSLAFTSDNASDKVLAFYCSITFAVNNVSVKVSSKGPDIIFISVISNGYALFNCAVCNTDYISAAGKTADKAGFQSACAF